MTDRVGLAVIGAGRMGELYGRIAQQLDSARLIAICGVSEEATLTLAGDLKVPGYFSGRYQEMLEAHPEIDAVVVSTPEWIHYAPAIESLSRGKHVLVEKPLATTSTEAWAIVDAARLSNTVLMVCHSQRFNPRFALMREAVQRGDIGSVIHVYARRHSLQSAVDRVLGNFPLPFWLAPHDIDMMLWTVGSRIETVSAWSRSGATDRTDFIGASLRFQNGVVGVLETSWSTPATVGRPLNELFTIRGTQGSIDVVGREQGLAIYRDEGAAAYPDTYHAPVIHGQIEGPYRSLLRHFVGAVQGRWQPCLLAREAAEVVDVAAAIDASLRSGTEARVNASAPQTSATSH